jgi:hypothetical protein
MKFVFVSDKESIPPVDASAIYVCGVKGNPDHFLVVNGHAIRGIDILYDDGWFTVRFKIGMIASDLRSIEQLPIDPYLTVIRELRKEKLFKLLVIYTAFPDGTTWTLEQKQTVRPLIDQLVSELHATFSGGNINDVYMQLSVMDLSLLSVKRLSEIYGTGGTHVGLILPDVNYLYSTATAEDGEEFQGKPRLTALNFSEDGRQLNVKLHVNATDAAPKLDQLRFDYTYVGERRLLGLPVRQEFSWEYADQAHKDEHFGYVLPFYINFPTLRYWAPSMRNRMYPTMRRLSNTYSVITLLSAKQVPRIGVNSFARLLPKELYRKLAGFLPGLSEQDKIEYEEFMRGLRQY